MQKLDNAEMQNAGMQAMQDVLSNISFGNNYKDYKERNEIKKTGAC